MGRACGAVRARVNKRLNFIFKPQGRALLVEHLEHLVVKRLDPARIAALSAFPRRHESGDVGRALNLPHQQCGHAGPPCGNPGMSCMDGFALTSFNASSMASIVSSICSARCSEARKK